MIHTLVIEIFSWLVLILVSKKLKKDKKSQDGMMTKQKVCWIDIRVQNLSEQVEENPRTDEKYKNWAKE